MNISDDLFQLINRRVKANPDLDEMALSQELYEMTNVDEVRRMVEVVYQDHIREAKRRMGSFALQPTVSTNSSADRNRTQKLEIGAYLRARSARDLNERISAYIPLRSSSVSIVYGEEKPVWTSMTEEQMIARIGFLRNRETGLAASRRTLEAALDDLRYFKSVIPGVETIEDAIQSQLQSVAS